MSDDLPFEIGQNIHLTKWYDATDSAVTNELGQKLYRVAGRICKVGEVDWVASDHFLEEILKWTLCVEGRVTGSHDITVQPIKASNIKEFKIRFPGAFEEYEKRYANVGMPEARAPITSDIPRELIGEYKGPAKPIKLVVNAVDRKAALLRELADLEGQAEYAAARTPHPDEPDLRDQSAVAGQDIMEFRSIPEKARRKLMDMGVMTVEQLAGLPDGLIDQFGPGQWQKWRMQASDAIKAAALANLNEAA